MVSDLSEVALPFTTAELTAMLRRYLDEAQLDLVSVQELPFAARPSRGNVRLLGIDLERAGHREHYEYILKEPPAFARGEIGFYLALASQVALTTPELVGADARHKWLLLEPYPTTIPAENWTADDYRQAVKNLAYLHDRFWSLHEDLSIYSWLGRPLAEDFETTMLSATKAMEAIVLQRSPAIITDSLRLTAHLAHALSHADHLARVLRQAPPTLLHGDYWAGNISLDEERAQIVYDWQGVSVGAALLDLVAFINNSLVWLAPLPITPAELIALYRAHLSALGRPTMSDTEWQTMWAHALIWRFLQEWLPALAYHALAPHILARVQQIWIDPVIAAVSYVIPSENSLKVEVKKLDELMRDEL
jgi:thiamine kinase-like enzyme